MTTQSHKHQNDNKIK